jgi:hypothetical protein
MDPGLRRDDQLKYPAFDNSAALHVSVALSSAQSNSSSSR